MSTVHRSFVNLNAYLRNPGCHESAWRIQDTDPAAVLEIGSVIELAQIAERGIIDSIFLPDSPGTAEFATKYLPGMWFDPLEQLSAVAMATEQVGLVATASTTHSFPWDLARRIATLDFISHGRAGWNISTTAERAAARNFGDRPPSRTAERHERADEFVEVVLAIWDSWQDDAFVGPRPMGPGPSRLGCTRPATTAGSSRSRATCRSPARRRAVPCSPRLLPRRSGLPSPPNT
jgi:alkanesulfonate monooxygenase SsuD/methylene tetrahydromethanopterin reductase-like flavin-dependent oxidoreductase (luciferase family)